MLERDCESQARRVAAADDHWRHQRSWGLTEWLGTCAVVDPLERFEDAYIEFADSKGMAITHLFETHTPGTSLDLCVVSA